MSCGGTTTKPAATIPGDAYTPAEMRQFLVNNYPECFKPKGAVKLPLKVGIHNDILAQTPWLTMAEIKVGLKDYTDGPKYLEQCVHGAWRVDLKGDRVSMVTYWQQQHSAARLARLRAEWSGEGKTLGDILNEAFQQAGKTPMASTTTSPMPGMLDARSMVDTIQRLASHTAAETLASRDQQLIRYGETRSEDLTRMKGAFDTVMKDVVRELRGGRKIEAIKLYRNATGVGLKEAKDFVESMQGIPGMAPQPVYGVAPSKDYIVLSKTGYSGSYEDEGRYSDEGGAESLARRVAERSPTGETLLVKIIGRTKSVFSMG